MDIMRINDGVSLRLYENIVSIIYFIVDGIVFDIFFIFFKFF